MIRARKKTSQKSEQSDPALQRTAQVLANPPEDRTELLAEYFVLSDSFNKLHHQLYKTIAISDSYQQQLKELSRKQEQSDIKLRQLSEVALPICMYCHKIRTDDNYWQRLETYFSSHVDIMFSHGICPDCVKTTYSKLEGRGQPAAVLSQLQSERQKAAAPEDEPLREMKELLERISTVGDPLTPELEKIVSRYAKLLRRFSKIVTISDSYQFQLQDLNMRLELMVRTDILTGLANRMEMLNQLEVELKRSERHNKTFSLILGDLDLFKQVNDTFGHLAGDRVLRQIGTQLKDNLRSEDVCARWGGEEFMVLLPETSLEQAVIVAEKLAAAVRGKEIVWDTQPIHLTMSFGVGAFCAGCSIDEFIQQVDNALYAAKNAGRDRVVKVCTQKQVT
ncbi:diguanylate cyclase [Trichlorobacter lovleyi]|uniref:diguanylate cyclase n=1 Tax=Trichlorobacter lovleyi (strain ATCC BAA-1151 / DSM 17278 / SZ) TaxID=398767 RepID=B3E3K8_TRIL1|nr:diguanylate cyclase [Trichlorobacter lovleyi]ACD95827.1 diguanylate cyclase [Trichlorobacter lovleyi SZ]